MRSKPDFSLGNFMEYRTTKRLGPRRARARGQSARAVPLGGDNAGERDPASRGRLRKPGRGHEARPRRGGPSEGLPMIGLARRTAPRSWYLPHEPASTVSMKRPLLVEVSSPIAVTLILMPRASSVLGRSGVGQGRTVPSDQVW